MSANEKRLSVTLASNFKSVEEAERFIHSVIEANGIDDLESHRVEMAVRESVINAIQHGNCCDESKKVELVISLTSTKLTIWVRDEGQGFDVASIPNPLEGNNILKSSGRGIFIIQSFMDEFAVRRLPNDGSEVMMVKRLSSNANSNLT